MRNFKFKKILYFWFIFILVIISFPSVLAGEDANIDDELSVMATPVKQGSGGPIKIDIYATFYGGCCYPLYAYDVKPEVILPNELEFVDGISPEKISKFEATAGGGAVLAKFSCTIRSFVPGEYNIQVKVTTSNCGDAEGNVKITFTKGCVISIPEKYPKQSITGRSNSIKVSAYSPLENIEIKKVSLYYIIQSSDRLNYLNPKNNTITLDRGEKEGKKVVLEPVEFEENQWKGIIEEQNKESYLIYWIVAEDNFGNKTTSPAYVIEIIDLNKVHFQYNSLLWGSIVGSIFGVLIIAIIWDRVLKKPLKKDKLEGVIFIGSTMVDLKTDQVEKTNFQKTKNRYRIIIFLLVFIVALMLIFIAIQGGLYEILRTNVGG